MALFTRVLRLFVVIIPVVLSSECGDLRFSASTVPESASVDLIYTYASGNRYKPRAWYILRGERWTKLYESSQGRRLDPKYEERFRDNTYVLTISPVSTSDAGTYVVFCATDVNKQSKPADLNVVPQAVQQGLCGRLTIISNGSPVGSYVQFRFDAHKPQQQSIVWQRDIGGSFRDLGLEGRVELANNAALTVFARKLYSLSSDVGIYRVRCLDGSLSNIVELTVHIVPPGKPVIENTQSFPGCANCLLAIPNKYLYINCASYNGSAPVDLKLYLNNVKINSAVSQDNTRRVINVWKQQFIQEKDEDAIIKCTAVNSAIDTPLSTDVTVYLFREPSPPVIETLSGTEGKLAALTCVSSGGKPAPSVQFKYNETIYKPEPEHTVSGIDGTIRVRSVLYVNLTRSDNLRAVDCISTSLQSTVSKNEIVSVNFPPKEVRVDKLKQTTNLDGDTTLTVRCTTGESNPKSTVLWQGLDTMKRASNNNGNDIVGHNGGRSFYHDLTLNLTKSDNKKKIKCMVLNTEFPGLALSTSYRINIPYQPIVTIVGGPNITVYDGNDVTVTCSADSNPRSRLRWSKDGIILKESNKGSSLDLKLSNISIYNDSSIFMCSAHNGFGKEAKSYVTIFVKDNSLRIQDLSSTDENVGTIVGVMFLIIAIVVMVIVALVIVRRRRKTANDTFHSSVQIRIEDRQPSIRPPVEEPVYNNLTQRHDGHTVEPVEYAKVIPRSERSVIAVVDDTSNTAEYAVVIPRSQRRSIDNTLDEQQHQTDSTSTSNLVYADLDLKISTKGNPEDKTPVTRQQSVTQYVSIDFVKTKDLNENQSET